MMIIAQALCQAIRNRGHYISPFEQAFLPPGLQARPPDIAPYGINGQITKICDPYEVRETFLQAVCYQVIGPRAEGTKKVGYLFLLDEFCSDAVAFLQVSVAPIAGEEDEGVSVIEGTEEGVTLTTFLTYR